MSFAEMWQAADEGGIKIEPEPGTYTATVDSAEGFYSKAGKECVRVTLEILAAEEHPETVGKTFDHMMFFGNEVGARIAKENLALYGVEVAKVADFDELIDVLDRIEGVEADVRVAVNGSYTNINVLRSRTGKSDIPNNSDDFTSPPTEAADGSDHPM